MFSSALKSFSSNITANYTIASSPSSVAGAWKVFDGKKKSTGKAVSIFVFDRKSLEHQGGGLESRSGTSAKRKIHDEVVERLKKEASSLARLRHPNILELAEPVEDTRNGGLMFATEPITATLAGLLADEDDDHKIRGDRSRVSRYTVETANGDSKKVTLDELEIQKGLLQVAKGLEFLHESASLVHGNLTPEAIYINQKSDWKISGLGFSGPADESTSPSNTPPIALSELLYHDHRLPRNVQLNLDYTSPDFVLDTNISSSADMFSLGLIILAMYNSPHESSLHTGGNITTYKKIFSSSSSIPAASNNFLCTKPLPRQLLGDVLPRLVTRKPAQRMNSREFQQCSFFDNILMSTLQFLDSLPAKSPNEKSQFMRGLPRVLEQFPKSVLDKKILPGLLEETKDRELLALILANVFKIVEILPSGQRIFADTVLPQLREIFHTPTSKASSGERDVFKEPALIVILDKIGLIAENCPGKSFKDDVLPIIQLGLESPTHSVVDKSLTCLSSILGILDFSTIKNDLFPIVANVFTKTSSLSIKVRGLEALGILCAGNPTIGSTGTKAPNGAILDKYTVQEKVVPLLKGIKTKEPAVIMAALAVFKEVGKIADADFIAMNILPTLWSFSLGPLLNLEQFQAYMTLIKTMSLRIEQEQTRKLRDLASNSTNDFDSGRSNDLMSMPSNDPFGSSSVGEIDFERLVLGKSDVSRPQAQRSHTGNASSPVWPDSTNSMSSVFHSRNVPSSRAITPDHALNNFATLQPSSAPICAGSTQYSPHAWNGVQSMQSMQPLQPVQSMQSMQPRFSQPAGNSWGNTPAAKLGSTPWVSPTPTGTSLAWGNPQAAQNGSANTVSLHGKLAPAMRTNSFGIPPPPSTTNQGGTNTGLDKYESLI
ncbi:hypothetical protein MMC26_004043 [Xylographa opegraphella]|nr:hypothetical protein [Xylographa opegraphella]